MKRLVLTVAILIGLAAPAWADLKSGGDAYNRGDYAAAIREWTPFAEQGDVNAQYLLGFMYDNGQGVSQDYAEAAKWYRKAAEQGNAEAQNILGVMYGEGRGVPQDYVQAHMWLNLAASRLLPGALRAETVENRDIVSAKMTPAQIAEAQRLAREWKPKKEGK